MTNSVKPENKQLSPHLEEQLADPWLEASAIEQQLEPPVFQEQDFFVTDYGAVGNGETPATEAIRMAIEACHKAGGGRVIVQEGSYHTGPIHLKSGVNLHLQKGTVLLFSTNPADYVPLVYTRWEGVELMNYSPLIYAFEQENIAVTGEGILDGQASTQNWWQWRGDKQWGWQEGLPHQNIKGSRSALFQMGEEGVAVEARRFGQGYYLRPSFVQFYRCRNVLIEGITIKNSPMWAIHPVLCRHVIVQGVSVDSAGPNVDGCNPECCQLVLIRHCRFSVSHDCITLKSGRGSEGRSINVPTENVLIQHCSMANGHGAMVIGSETSGGIRNIFIENCSMSSPNLERALRIKTNSNRGGLIENIYLRHIRVGQVLEAPVAISMSYEEEGAHLPTIRNIEIKDMQVEDGGKTGILLEGDERSPMKHLRFLQVDIYKVEVPFRFSNITDISFDEVRINRQAQSVEFLKSYTRNK